MLVKIAKKNRQDLLPVIVIYEKENTEERASDAGERRLQRLHGSLEKCLKKNFAWHK
jgi:hypothetical protein